MLFRRENLIKVLDKHNAVVYLKSLNGTYMSMNTAGLNIMSDTHGNILGQTAHDIFDLDSANKMVATDKYVLQHGSHYSNLHDAKDRLTGKPVPMFSAKSVIRSPSGEPLGVVGISLVDYKDTALFSEACRILPRFLNRKSSYLLNELLELRTIAEFMNMYPMH